MFASTVRPVAGSVTISSSSAIPMPPTVPRMIWLDQSAYGPYHAVAARAGDQIVVTEMLLGPLADPMLNMPRPPGQVPQKHKTEVTTMGLRDKVRNRFMMSRGRAKEETGRVTRNHSMQAKGMAERASGAVRQVAEQAKDAGRNIRHAAKH
jgi:uncharacterized protein YjbJ (UPF0337 family)